MSNIIIAGQAAEGSGAIVGWHGAGPLQRSEIVRALMAAECPESWAPRAKSSEAHAGHAIGKLNHQGLIVRRSKRPRATPAGLPIAWRARWTVQVAAGAAEQLGDASAPVVLVAELIDDELHLQADDHHRHHAAQVQATYNELRDAEVFQAGDVTAWLARTLIIELGATRFGLGYYVPAGNRAQANRLATAMMARWGCGWICPLLPVATSEELKIGIARGLMEDVNAIVATLQRERDAAKESNKADMSPATAARLLRSVTDMAERVAAYRPLVGEALIGECVRLIQRLGSELGQIADASSVRFSMLDLDPPSEAEQPVAPAISPAERAAERALEERRDRAYNAIVSAAADSGMSVQEFMVGPAAPSLEEVARESHARTDADVARGFQLIPARPPRTNALPSNADIAARRDAYQVPPPPAEPQPDPTDSDVRFGLLELD